MMTCGRGKNRFDKNVHGALARTHILGEAHALLLVAGRDAVIGKKIGRLHRDEA